MGKWNSGIVEKWNGGKMEKWNSGMVEYWYSADYPSSVFCFLNYLCKSVSSVSPVPSWAGSAFYSTINDGTVLLLRRVTTGGELCNPTNGYKWCWGRE